MKNAHFPATLFIVLLATAAHAQDFRIETDVFIGGETQPAQEYLTLFQADKIYDFLLSEPEETTILDVNRGRFLLLDPQRSVKAELFTKDLSEFNLQLREIALPRNADLFRPNFTYTHNKETGFHVLASDRLTYRAKGLVPQFEEAAERYREFADWYAQLNAVRPANLPPYGRMELNRVLAERGLIPEDVEREITVTTVIPYTKAKVRTHHSVYWRLNQKDQQRIRRAEDQIAEYVRVTPDEYFELDKLADKK